MKILDKIKEILNLNRKYATIITNDLTKTYKDPTPLEIGLYTNNEPLKDKPVNINIHNVDYTRKTDNNGIARLNINLPIGEYDAHITFDDPDYQYIKTFVNVSVNPVIVTSDLNMIERDGSKFIASVEDANGNKLSGIKVVFTVNGRDYERTSDENGVVSLTINLNHGEYEILTKSNEVCVKNKIHVDETVPEPVTSNCFGYWVFGKDMLNVNLQSLKEHGVTDLFLNYYAFNTHGEKNVLDWIKQAKQIGIHVHIWMQCFYNGEWINPKTTDLSSKIDEAKKYANIPDVYGIHLDYLRYPGDAYKTEGASEAVNNFVKNVKNVINDKFLSCAVMPENESKYYYGQDINKLGEICDVVIPMQYKGNYKADTSWLASTTKQFSSKADIWSGLQSYRSDDDPTVLSESELQNDINTCINNGAKGAILFRYGLSPDITFNKTPEPEPEPVKLYPYFTKQGGGYLGQKTGYTCGPHSLMQCIYRLTGEDVSEMELASVCGTTQNGTDHQGLATGLAWFNRKYGYNLKMTWKNFSEVGFDGLQRYYENGAVFCHLLYRDQWGHYEVPLTSSADPMRILNSLGDRCGDGYCGYIESRSKATQRSYINGISQKSICIITR